jgi:putative transposase
VSAFIDEQRDSFGVERICRVLGVSRSAYYARVRAAPSTRAATDAVLRARIRRIHADSAQTYGAPRVTAQLRREGFVVNHKRVERLLRVEGLQGLHRRRFTRTTVADSDAGVPADLVDRHFRAETPDRLWCSDLTYVKTHQGWLYVAVITDVCSRRIVGWATADHLRTELPLEALSMALFRRNVARGRLIHHSDRGSQYLSFRYSTRLADAGIAPSVGSKGDAFDNALCESFIETLKRELIDRRTWRTRSDAELAILSWIEGWYNQRRLHSSLGMRSPAEYEADVVPVQLSLPDL